MHLNLYLFSKVIQAIHRFRPPSLFRVNVPFHKQQDPDTPGKNGKSPNINNNIRTEMLK